MVVWTGYGGMGQGVNEEVGVRVWGWVGAWGGGLTQSLKQSLCGPGKSEKKAVKGMKFQQISYIRLWLVGILAFCLLIRVLVYIMLNIFIFFGVLRKLTWLVSVNYLVAVPYIYIYIYTFISSVYLEGF